MAGQLVDDVLLVGRDVADVADCHLPAHGVAGVAAGGAREDGLGHGQLGFADLDRRCADRSDGLRAAVTGASRVGERDAVLVGLDVGDLGVEIDIDRAGAAGGDVAEGEAERAARDAWCDRTKHTRHDAAAGADDRTAGDVVETCRQHVAGGETGGGADRHGDG